MALEPATEALVRVAIALARRDPDALEAGLDDARRVAEAQAVEEVLLQSYLFLGFPATLDGLTRWRRRVPIPTREAASERSQEWAARGSGILERVYGNQAERLRENVRALHPALERWMVEEGYGKVLGRAGLTLVQRELAIAAQLAALGAFPQLYSHLRGALRVGATRDAVETTLGMVASRAGGREIWETWERVVARTDGGDVPTTSTDRRDRARPDPKGV